MNRELLRRFKRKRPHRHSGSILCILILLHLPWVIIAQNVPVPLISADEQRIREIEGMLADHPSGLGAPCNKREVWDQLLKSGKYDSFLKEMENFTFPPFSEKDYFSLADGTATSSGRGLQMMRNRATALSRAVWAECLTNDNLYTAVIEKGLRDLIDQKSWVSPRIDYGFKNYHGTEYSVELTSSLYAHTIAQTLHLVGHKLTPALRKDAVDALYKRVFNPALNKIRTLNNAPENNFFNMTNNWNHVCLAGLAGAALTVIEDKHERAVFAWMGEYYSQNGLLGFGEDGYCSEGIGYFNYGFGHFILLCEIVRQATRGKLDLFADPKVRKIAWYPVNLEIINGVFPAISDSKPGAKPESSIIYYCSRNLGLGLTAYDTLSFEGNTDDIRQCVMMVFPNSASLAKVKNGGENSVSRIRSIFDQTGVYVGRPLQGSPCLAGVALKGGNNHENHNHNDVGSYTVVLGDEIMAGDPGSIPYTANIFDSRFRYSYKTLGSYGHPVPLVAGMEQQSGPHTEAKILQNSFSETEDKIALDLTRAYNYPSLVEIKRLMVYSRLKKGKISFTDTFTCTKPEIFETAIITRAKWTRLKRDEILLEGDKVKMKVNLESSDKLIVRSEVISEGGVPYTRIGIRINKRVKSGMIRVSYTPVSETGNCH